MSSHIRSSRRRNSAFTLVELLVVIGIIALLVSVLLPSLMKAREAALRTQCMSNQRQLLLAVEMYRSLSDGWWPAGVHSSSGAPAGSSIAGSRTVRLSNVDVNEVNDHPVRRGAVEPEGWTNLGWLWYRRTLKDGRVYYCPAEKGIVTYERNWHMGTESAWSRIYTNYAYRFGGDASGLTGADRADEINIITRAMRGKVKGVVSVTSDHFGYPDGWLAHWPHTRPYGIVVGWTDGHVTYVPLLEKDWRVIGGFNLARADQYMVMYFRGFDKDNLQEVRRAFGL